MLKPLFQGSEGMSCAPGSLRSIFAGADSAARLEVSGWAEPSALPVPKRLARVALSFFDGRAIEIAVAGMHTAVAAMAPKWRVSAPQRDNSYLGCADCSRYDRQSVCCTCNSYAFSKRVIVDSKRRHRDCPTIGQFRKAGRPTSGLRA